ncbi:GNAT family N-acetyltransferase [Plantactinospora sp. KLBMP9567]|uniref:GNAT family N-acetyltransferase n=1 Tax=Plantactinospora sp. KLBMP9567 TaxID=3085900 RepID=UPI00298157EF|nr:GNAT family N-acetyltransferase [Plantactinospora sp. KLBMP9567]MDW5323149.1 GNAT family N-acetyltransferase [Plantactinospora sp. KLBMP9567]
MASVRDEPFDRLERFYDAVPRDGAHTENFGGLVLFVRNGAGWPFYARPRLGATEPPSAADVTAVRQRQRDLGLPETFEWVHENHPDLLAVARSAGLAVLEAPLMVLDPAALPPPENLAAARVRILDPAAPTFAADVAARRAVAAVGFAAPGTEVGVAGPAARDTALVELPVDSLDEERTRTAAGRRISAVVELPGQGPVASGMALRVDDVAEIAGIATLPTARRRGLGAAVTAALARRLLDDGTNLVFLSAGSEEIARVYLRVGFRRIGTACIAEPAPVG